MPYFILAPVVRVRGGAGTFDRCPRNQLASLLREALSCVPDRRNTRHAPQPCGRSFPRQPCCAGARTRQYCFAAGQ